MKKIFQRYPVVILAIGTILFLSITLQAQRSSAPDDDGCIYTATEYKGRGACGGDGNTCLIQNCPEGSGDPIY